MNNTQFIIKMKKYMTEYVTYNSFRANMKYIKGHKGMITLAPLHDNALSAFLDPKIEIYKEHKKHGGALKVHFSFCGDTHSFFVVGDHLSLDKQILAACGQLNYIFEHEIKECFNIKKHELSRLMSASTEGFVGYRF